VQVQTKVITIKNRVSSTVEASLRPGSSDRYTVHPQQIRLKPGQSEEVEIKLKVTRFPQAEKAVEQGQRDVFHIKTPFFDQKFAATFYLSPQVLQHAASGHQVRRQPQQAHLWANFQKSTIEPALAPEKHQVSALVEDAAGNSQPAVENDGHMSPHKPSLLKFSMPASPAALPTRERLLERAVRLIWPTSCV
jgi:hypothetical protein